MSRTKRDKRGGHIQTMIRRPAWKFKITDGDTFTVELLYQTLVQRKLTKRITKRKHRAYGRIRIADMLQMHEDYLEDRGWWLGMPNPYEDDLDDYDYDDFVAYDEDRYDDFYDYEPDPEPRYEIFDRNTGSTLAEGHSLSEILNQILQNRRSEH